MPAAADLRLAARPDEIELDKLFDIYESSLIRHSVLLGRELGDPGLGSTSAPEETVNCRRNSLCAERPDANCGTTSSSGASFPWCCPPL
jgi:hypothetical protein